MMHARKEKIKPVVLDLVTKSSSGIGAVFTRVKIPKPTKSLVKRGKLYERRETRTNVQIRICFSFTNLISRKGDARFLSQSQSEVKLSSFNMESYCN